MKKVLLATTVLASFAGAALADDATKVKISGYGRVGIVHNSKATGAKTQVVNRLRFNIDASTTTDSGVVFGARLRLQNDTGDSGTTGNNALLYTEYQGLRVEVGNTNTAYDNTTLLWGSEMGYRDSSFGDPYEYTFYYDSKAGGSQGALSNNHMGLFASYTVGDFTGMISYVNPDQGAKSLAAGWKSEIAVSGLYKYQQFTFEAAAVKNGAGISGNDPWFIGAAYAVNENTNIGLNYIDEHMGATAIANQKLAYPNPVPALPAVQSTLYVDPGKTITLYGNYKMDKTTLKAYIAHNDGGMYDTATNTLIKNASKNAYGIGADYDLGGARLSGAIQRGYAKQTIVDVGVRFDF